jgi:FixJ family two-component response regulator
MTVLDKEAAATVVVIDDDPDIREALRGLFQSVGLGVELFASVHEFLGAARPDIPGCLVLESDYPGAAGSICRASWPRQIYTCRLSLSQVTRMSRCLSGP